MKKYSKILISVAIIVLLFSIYFIGACNGKKKNQPTIIDTTQSYIKKLASKDSVIVLENENIKVTVKIKADSISFLKKQLCLNRIETVIKIEHAKQLPLDSGILMMAQIFNDKTQIKSQVEGNDTGVVITPRDVKQVNTTQIMKDFFKGTVKILRHEIRLYAINDSLKNIEIKNDSDLFLDKNSIVIMEQEQNTILTKQIASLTKQYKRQKLWKTVFEGISGTLLIFSALK